MLLLMLGLPVAALGAVAIWSRIQQPRLAIVDLLGASPKIKRHPRSGQVDAVVLHQMGFSRGNDPMRYSKVTAHFIVLPNGTVAQLHPMSARLSASDGFNGRSVAVEFAGNFQSAGGKWWKPERYGMDYATAEQIEAGRKLLRLLQGLGVRYVFAHRQSSADRENDPGPEIWRGVGQWGVEVLGLLDGGEGYAVTGGRAVPESWRVVKTA